MAESPVLYEVREGVAVVTLNRPDVLNAFTPEMLDELGKTIRRAPDDGARCILLTGAGRGFSAGMDLASIQSFYDGGGHPDFISLLKDHFYPVVAAITGSSVPVVGAVNGVAAGAGMSMALACDLRIAAENARFVTAFTKIGLVPDSGMAYTLPRLVGGGKAMELMLLGEPMNAQAALEAGMVNRVVPPDELPGAAFELARQLAEGPTRAFALTRRLAQAAERGSLTDLLAVEAQLQAEAGATEDHRGAVAAFLEKRPPTITGH